MPLDRTWYNTLVDDDGSNTVGSVWNKASVDSLMDATDAAFASAAHAAITLPVSGFLVDYNAPGTAATTVWLLQPAAGTYLTGVLKPTVPGTQHLLICSGSALVISNAHSSSASDNQLYCPGYADYTLNSWYSVWIYYANALGKWIVLKP